MVKRERKLFDVNKPPSTPDEWVQAEELTEQAQASEKPKASPRPMGKSRDPNYKQLGLYVKKDIHRKVKSKAAAEDIEISELVESLLIDWLGE